MRVTFSALAATMFKKSLSGNKIKWYLGKFSISDKPFIFAHGPDEL